MNDKDAVVLFEELIDMTDNEVERKLYGKAIEALRERQNRAEVLAEFLDGEPKRSC